MDGEVQPIQLRVGLLGEEKPTVLFRGGPKAARAIVGAILIGGGGKKSKVLWRDITCVGIHTVAERVRKTLTWISMSGKCNSVCTVCTPFTSTSLFQPGHA